MGGSSLYDWIGTVAEKRWLRRIGRRAPEVAVLPVCFAASRVMFWLAGGLRARVTGNMAQLLKEAGADEVRRWSKAYFFNLCVTLYELFIDSPDRSRPAGRFQAEGEAGLERALSEGKGVIVFAPHLGNFFYYYWYLSQAYRCMTVVTAGSRELRPIYLRFQQMGCAGLDYDATPPLELIRSLRKHLQQNGVVFLLGDFYRPQFPPAAFFGRATRSPGGTAALALDLQVPVIPFYGYRTRGFRHRLVFGQPVYLHKEFGRHQRTEATNLLNAVMEKAVAEIPQQWFYWFNAQERWETE